MNSDTPAIGIIGGSGLYQMEELRDAAEHKVGTPFGAPSDKLVGGKVSGRFDRWREDVRAQRLFPAATRTRAPDFATRIESSCQYLRASLA